MLVHPVAHCRLMQADAPADLRQRQAFIEELLDQ
jgi:hypothetical protein